ncbi:T9SS C-terminal target domain-containing protein [Paraflavitalea soli]|uniref:T9SS C-terminal target domain-containing protein n=1 Tax=Paraflavitalea soli TaxID=2315862 RepID=A0A3B7MPA0_9BACT|nr:S8 family peptidase [Paraflavitalea soli]AXY75149.1 T9SS C-terminal target domain-containing protein [Paraflavitalea soli]
MRYSILLTICCCYCLTINAQESDSALLHQKLAPALARSKAGLADDRPGTWWVVVSDKEQFKAFLAKERLPVIITGEYAPTRLLIVQTSHKTLVNKLLKTPWVIFADQPRLPREEQVVSSHDNTTSQINTVHGLYPALNGNGLTVSVKENKPDTTDIDLKGRYLSTPLSSPTISQHAGIMSTLIGGGGNSDYSGKGAAWGVTLSSSDFASLLPDANTAYQQYQITVQNHSYGTGVENYYGADAAAYDASSIANTHLLHVFSAGNAGNQTSTQGAYAGIAGYANLTGSFKMGKNMITTGAINSFYQVEALSSKGPAYDGRVKPELVAFGEDGSSGAAAITSGIAVLVQQAFKNTTGQLPAASLVKAILLTTADDIGTPGIDFQTGYGKVNALKAVEAVQQSTYASGYIAQGQTYTTALTIPADIQQVKLTLCWYDVPATPNANKALINDVDLELINTSTGQHWQPWVLSHAAHIDSLVKEPVRKRDSLNNNEQITLNNPAPGNYIIQVKGYSIPSGPQAFSLAWHLDTAGRFRWYYPIKADQVRAGDNNIIRWASSFSSNDPARLEYSTDGGHQWKLITNNADLTRGYYQWTAPDTCTTALLKITTDNHSFLSDTFNLSARIKANTGFNCQDSFLLTWNRPTGVSQFVVYALKGNYLSPLLTTTDTNVILSKAAHPALYYTVSPVLANDYNGMKAYSFNYTAQGIGCYIKSFLADLVDNTVKLMIELGTRYAVQKITVEKLGISGYNRLQSIEPVNSLQYQLTDNTLHWGVNTYRLKIQRTDDSFIYSQPETVYNLQDAGYIVYPNPVPAGAMLHILTAIPGNNSIILFNATGQQVLQKKLTEMHEQLSLLALQRGIYFYLIRKDGQKEQTGSIVIY